jgi:sulfur-oxidizing protein SoxZ
MVSIPDRVAPGEVFEVKILIQHPMETGFRPGPDGVLLPRHIITDVTCFYGGEQVFRADFFPAVSANPYLAFHLRADASGTIEIVWHDDRGGEFRQAGSVTIA